MAPDRQDEPWICYQLVAPLERVLGQEEVERRRSFLQANAAPATRVEVRSVAAGYPSIESERDAVAVSPHIVAGLRRAAAEGASAGIVGCFSDPALDAVRETVRMPVVGPGQSSVLLAMQLGERFSILSPLDSGAKRQLPRLRAYASRSGSPRCAASASASWTWLAGRTTRWTTSSPSHAAASRRTGPTCW